MANNGSLFSLSQLLTGTAPTAKTEGQPLKGLTALTVVVETAVPASQTLSGAGTLLCYMWDSFDGSAKGGPAAVGAWSRCPAGDLSVTLTAVPRQAFGAYPVIGARGARIMWVPSGVTVSAGTTVTVYQLGHNPNEVY